MEGLGDDVEVVRGGVSIPGVLCGVDVLFGDCITGDSELGFDFVNASLVLFSLASTDVSEGASPFASRYASRYVKERVSLPVTCMSNYSGQSAVLRDVYD